MLFEKPLDREMPIIMEAPIMNGK
jgi:hypothetical protein